MSDNFVIFALPRTGSDTLARLLECHPLVLCILEPFDRWLFDGQYARLITDGQSVADALEVLWSTYDGIKHVWQMNGYPFDDGGALNRRVLLTGRHKVLFLNRRNTLRRVVSQGISEQTQIWHFDREIDREGFAHFPLRALDDAALRDQIKMEHVLLPYLRGLLARSEHEYLELWYEDFFSSEVSFDERLERLNVIFEFLNVPTVTRHHRSVIVAMQELFDPSRTRMNSEATYLRVPGIREIESRFGCDRTGWLFQDRLVTQ